MELSVEEALQGDYILIDLRSEKEYGLSHIPFAASLPLLDDEARAIVGFAYKQISREEAFKLGLDHVLPKLDFLKKGIDKLLEKKEVVLYCSRGGMRSSSVYKLYAHDNRVHLLEGGYKAYRKFILDKMPSEIEKRDFLVFQGLTGVGKTRILQELAADYNVLDLELLASHRGSVFGGLGLDEQPSQKQFQNDIFSFLYSTEGLILVESESSKIGKLLLPKEIRSKILTSPLFLIEAPMDYRVKFLEEDYGVKLRENKDELIEDIWMLKSQLGSEACSELAELLERDEMARAIELLLINYYDPLYRHSMKTSEERLLFTFDASKEDVTREIGRKINEILYS
ncbi:MAG: tRNA 2-selenouridine(34) synthase MnmH [Tissierellia bacterium]|nr:tRNA 2-selenouridine(34) synthase MnmH [Tissierellia bacterium]